MNLCNVNLTLHDLKLCNANIWVCTVMKLLYLNVNLAKTNLITVTSSRPSKVFLQYHIQPGTKRWNNNCCARSKLHYEILVIDYYHDIDYITYIQFLVILSGGYPKGILKEREYFNFHTPDNSTILPLRPIKSTAVWLFWVLTLDKHKLRTLTQVCTS